jgi:hypothetical protein
LAFWNESEICGRMPRESIATVFDWLCMCNAFLSDLALEFFLIFWWKFFRYVFIGYL